MELQGEISTAPLLDPSSAPPGAEEDVQVTKDVAPEEADVDGQSPVPEVALTVATTDDPSLPCMTWRMMGIGVVICSALAFVNQFLWFRQSSIIINPIAATVTTLYLGRFVASIQALFDPRTPPFSVKEHVLISIFCQSGSAYGNGNAYAVDIVTIMKQLYKVDVSFVGALLLLSTTQVLGYGFAGMLRRYLVDPANMWWPVNMVFVSLFRTLHEPDHPAKGQLTKMHFFFLVVAISFAWYCVPDYFMPIVASMSWVCWVWPNSVTAAQLGGGYFGLGLGVFSLDWATVSAFLGTPLASPWFATANVAVGFVLACYVILPVVYWNNIYESKSFPILTSSLFQANGLKYPVLQILTPELMLNETAYQAVGRPWLSGYFVLSYGLGFAALTASVVHVALWYGPEIVTLTLRAASEDRPDIHTRLMRRYPTLPDWWFLVLLAVSIAASVACVESFKYFQLPWWGLLFGAALSFIFTLPIGIITATTNQTPGLNIITEMIWGYIKPGEPISNVCFKTYGYISMTQAIAFLSDFKLGTYMKIPPRWMFLVQVLGTLLAGVINLGVAFWMFGQIEGICNTDELPGNSPWTCPSANVFFSASIIWGLVGPARMWSAGAYYGAMNWLWLVGALAPFPFWYLYRLLPSQGWLKDVNTPVIFTSVAIMPPAGPVNYIGWITLGFVFNYCVFKYNKGWWTRYNYLLSAGLDTGVFFMSLLIFVSTQIETNSVSLDWWGSGVLPSGLASLDNCPYVHCPTNCSALSSFPQCKPGANPFCPVNPS